MAGTITIAAGLRNMDGSTYRRASWDTPLALAELLEEADEGMEGEGWWSPHVFRGARRGEDWIQASALAIDVDGPTKQAGEPLPEPLREQLEQAFREGACPGSIFHVTHSGFRVVFPLSRPTRSKEAWLKAHAGARELVRRWASCELGDSWVVDPAVANLANLNWLPNTRDEKGRERKATVIYGEQLFDVTELGLVTPEEVRAPEPDKPQREGTLGDKRKAQEALLSLGVDVATEYESWIEVGQVLHVVYGGAQAGCDLWDAWSKQAPNYDLKALERKWRTFKSSGRGLGSLIFLARSRGSPGAWEAGPEILGQMGFQGVAPPEPDEDWVERIGEREESEEATASSRTFRLRAAARYLACPEPLWFPPSPRG